ncbi:MAG: hypothetical protein AUI89_08415 [Gemmatimonadetes bacterium 13_1_40CM_3_65_8]|nr:MAG: hypothetical protein AUH75_11620 [Gemmatimonadetes bacterium 13_1_40CM_4_65_7]OLC99676.1 MAG: hypothetical protein AUI89_08415 [Gemmatimonadetes bacterium 13_1_40CM_3_65_8]
MIYLVAAAERRSADQLPDEPARLRRDFRRFNLPVQLALAAATDVVPAAVDPASMAVVSLAPCQNGSPELYRWAEAAIAAGSAGRFGATRMNPTHTLHVIDNLALSAFAIAYGTDGYCLGVGGAPGQAWCGLEIICDRLADGREREALLMAGDQASVADATGSRGVALLFSARRRPYVALGRPVEFVAIEHRRRPAPQPVAAHAAAGLCDLLGALALRGGGPIAYEVPAEQTDGIDQVTVLLRVA